MEYDILRIKNISFYAFHGDDIKERELGQRYEVDAEMKIDAQRAVAQDDVRYTVDYKSVYKTVEKIITGRRFKLIETLASHMADVCLNTYDIKEIVVRVRKLKPPIEGILDYVEIEIVRTKK